MINNVYNTNGLMIDNYDNYDNYNNYYDITNDITNQVMPPEIYNGLPW